MSYEQNESRNLRARWRDYAASKTTLFWACAGSVAVTLLIGFTWGGWTTGANAARMAESAADNARTTLAAAVCVERFRQDADADAQFAALEQAAYWSRGDFIERGGWVELPGLAEPVDGAATACARRLMEVKATAADTTASSG